MFHYELKSKPTSKAHAVRRSPVSMTDHRRLEDCRALFARDRLFPGRPEHIESENWQHDLDLVEYPFHVRDFRLWQSFELGSVTFISFALPARRIAAMMRLSR
jgi:hypothetical protein